MYKYPHTHFRCNDPLEAIKYLDSHVWKIEKYLKKLTDMHNRDVVELIADLQALVDKIKGFTADIEAAISSNNTADQAWREAVSSSMSLIANSIKNITARTGSLVECIEESILRNKRRIDGHDEDIAAIRVDIQNLKNDITDIKNNITNIWDYLKELLLYVSGFDKKLFTDVGVVDANSRSLYYDPLTGESAAGLVTLFAVDQQSLTNNDAVVLYPNGYFATDSPLNVIEIYTRAASQLRSGGAVKPNTYALPIMGEVNENTGTFTLQVQCGNENLGVSNPSYSFCNYYAGNVTGIDPASLGPTMAHGDGTKGRTVWMIMRLKDSKYTNIIDRSDCVLSVTQGGVTAWNMAWNSTGITSVVDPRNISDFGDRRLYPMTFGVDHKVSIVRNGGLSYLVFQANSTNDGFNDTFGAWQAFVGPTGGTFGPNNIYAFNITVSAHSASAMEEFNNGRKN